MLDSTAGDPRAARRFSLRNKKWKYRGEGNANLVLALPQEHKIVRLRKCDGDGEEREREHVWREAVFCKGVMVPLLGECYIQPPDAACMERAEVRHLDQLLRTQRPAHRHHKSLQFGYVTIYPDYALLPMHLRIPPTLASLNAPPPTFCVEVKPKQGWVSPSDRRMPKCTFCLNQYLKLKNGSIRDQSSYCPLDLFSGNRARMMKALRALIAAPQNNLKIFKDGVLVYGEDMSSDLPVVLQSWFGDTSDVSRLVDKLCNLVLEALTCDLTGCEKLSDSETDNESDTDVGLWDRGYQSLLRPNSLPAGFGSNGWHRLSGPGLMERIPTALVEAVVPLLPGPPCDWTVQPLPEDSILGRVLSVQKLEQTGSDRVYEAYKSWSRVALGDYGYIAGMLSVATGNGPGLSPIHRYLLATTAKDCSIMVTFQRREREMLNNIPARHVVQDRDGHNYVMNIGVSDLDPKPLSCIEKHRKRDYEVLTACLQLLTPEAGSGACGVSTADLLFS